MARPWAGVEGRVLIAPDDDPLEPDPTWVRVDAPGGDFPDQFVAGYDTTNGKQTLLSQTGTGAATVFINDHKYGLFDPRNTTSPYYQKLDGKQVLLQLYDPVLNVWEPQFQGLIDNIGYALNNKAVNAAGQPINASLQISAVDAFDYAAGFGLTPGLAGDRPPNGGDDGVWYAPTTDEVFVRIIQILADMGIDESRYVVFSGNVALTTAKYNPDEPALNALRDCADAEFPFVANLYVDRFGRIVFHGRYGRLDPSGVSAAAGNDRWDYQVFKLGDGAAVRDDSERTQMRVLEFEQARHNVLNVGVCYPQGTQPDQMPSQVYADVASINAYGHYAAPPMSDLLTGRPINDILNGHPSWTKYIECEKFVELLVKNQKDPRESITAVQVKTVDPIDSRAAKVWHCLTRSDVSDMINVKVGYPAGVGMTGDSPIDEYFIEGRTLRVRPLNSSPDKSDLPGYDYVELDLNVSPAIWSQDTHGVFPSWPGDNTLEASFTYASAGGHSIAFTDTSVAGPSGPIIGWKWVFGDGSTSTSQNPTHNFGSSGNRSVQLIVTGTPNDGADGVTRRVSVP